MKKVLMLAVVLLGTSAMMNAQQTPSKSAQAAPAKEVKATKKAAKKAAKAEKKADATMTTATPAKK